MMKLFKALIPLVLFSLIVVFLLKGLQHDPRTVPSTLLGKPMPTLSGINPTFFHNRVTLLNVFASWCLYCRAEHPVLMDIAQTKRLYMLGLDYKDQADKVSVFLKQYGNPYSKVIADPKGRIAISLGVYGTPETFLIDKKGRIRYKHVGPLSPDDWKNTLQPLVHQLIEEL